MSPGSTLRWRPFAPVVVLHPATKVRRQFNRALLDTGGDHSVFPERLLVALGLAPLPAAGHQIVWHGVSYPVRFAQVELVLTDGAEEFRWNPIVGFSAAPIPYIVLGQSGCLEIFNVTFFGKDQYSEIERNSAFPGTSN